MTRHTLTPSCLLAVLAVLAAHDAVWAQPAGDTGAAGETDTSGIEAQPGQADPRVPRDAPANTVSDTSGPAPGEPGSQPGTQPGTQPGAANGAGASGSGSEARSADDDAAGAVTAMNAGAKAAGQAVDPEELPPAEEEAQGACATPRQAWLQLLYWLQKGQRWQPAEAAKCFNTKGFDPEVIERRAVMFKETLDSKGVYIKVDYIPTDPDYTNDAGMREYREPAVLRAFGDEFYLERVGRRWVVSAETVAHIPEIYPVTGVIEGYIPDWLKFSVAGVDAWKYLLLILVYIIARMISFIVVLVIDRYVSILIQRTRAKYLDRIVDRAEDPIGLLVIAAVFYISVPMLLLPIRFTELMLLAIEGMAAYSCVWLGYRLIDVLTDYMMTKAEKTESKLDDQLVPLVSKTLKVFVSVVGAIFIMQNLGVNVASLLAGLGLGGLAFALAAKDTIANFFGSVMIFIDKPFQIGDWVVVGNTEGVIEEVGFRTSRVRTFYNSLVTVPNALVTNAVVDNYGARQYRRYVATLGLTYDTPPDKVEAFCEGVRAIIQSTPGMRQDFYLVEFKEFGASGLEIMVYCFMVSDTWNEELRTRSNLNLEIMRLADELGVSFAFPSRTLYVNSLPELGQSVPNHYGPNEHDDLAAVINGFAPGGKLGRPTGLQLTKGYDCGTGGRGDEDGG